MKAKLEMSRKFKVTSPVEIIFKDIHAFELSTDRQIFGIQPKNMFLQFFRTDPFRLFVTISLHTHNFPHYHVTNIHQCLF